MALVGGGGGLYSTGAGQDRVHLSRLHGADMAALDKINVANTAQRQHRLSVEYHFFWT